jgi:hypothetical protein
MKMPWQDRTGLAKVTAFLATVLIVSLGLCGTNFFAVIFFVPLGGPGPQPGIPEPSHWPADVLTTTGAIELIGIAGSLIGLLVVAFITIYRSVVQHFSGR